MKFFLNAKLPDNGFHCGLDAAFIQRLVNKVGIFQPSFSTWKEKMGMFVHFSEIFQHS